MKYIKKYKLFETGEWDSSIDLEYVLENPDDDCEECNWIKALHELLIDIDNEINDENVFSIDDIKGFDMYQGPYAKVYIFDKIYSLWQLDEYMLYIEDFPIRNVESNGFTGDTYDISLLLKDIKESGSIDLYLASTKYNL
jgi:hypothetical protein